MKTFTTFQAGFLGGALAGWYSTKKYYRTKCDMEVQDMRNLLDETIAESNDRVKTAMEVAQKKVENAEVKAQRAADDRQIFAEALTRLGYTSKEEQSTIRPWGAPEQPETEHPLEEDDYLLDPGALEVQRKQPPALIDEETYSTDIYSGFEKKEVLWYPEDEVLLDGDTSELMDDPYSFLGKDWIPIVERDGEAYVRNYRWEVDYLIVPMSGKGVDNMTIST